ncbi:hypothetical protein CI109_102780 [Kwoniella shandongensis]|uniref:Uncharacterized protein n=1 Tax=Kwoniella shandongensis TaxID=1734106 RepID=A0A5M6BV02_9TREE|nr:uncharacterized protein CI109_004899 [Kwoniella shandongensis]KAA5526696.1 hypothetical protein CI109_004899 [Kwoniella shandongensis]
MSPSRIPRPGGTPNSSPVIGTSTRSNPNTNPGSPALGTIVHANAIKANNPFAQMHNKQMHPNNVQGSPGAGSPTINGIVGGGRPVPQAQTQAMPTTSTQRRRPKPPSSAELDDSPPPRNYGHGLGHSPTLHGSSTIQRRPVPADSPSASALGHGVRRPTTTTTSTTFGQSQGQRSILRQPSTPVLGSADKERRTVSGGAGGGMGLIQRRPRAVSSAAGNTNQLSSSIVTSGDGTGQFTQGQGQGQGYNLRSSSSQIQLFYEPREPSVPPHIRSRLRLVHQLGVVLGIDAAGISGKIDIPGLLARVDQAYDYHRGVGVTTKVDMTGGIGTGTGGASGGARTVSVAGGQGQKGVTGGGGGGGGGGMFGMFKRLGGKKSVGDGLELGQQDHGQSPSSLQEGPAFGVSLSDTPPGSWCTSLIGGQRHDLPLVVFTVVEEIYRRGMSQPGIFRLAGDGTRISHLTKVFNLPPLYGDSLTISTEPIHNLTGLVKRYVRDLPEPILDDSLFPAFLAFCVGEGEGEEDEADREGVSSSTASDRIGGDAKDGLAPRSDSDDDTPSSVDIGNGRKTTSFPPRLPLSTRITAAQILLRLLPPLHFSLFIYLLAFLGQLPLFPDNRLNIESISIIFGPAMCAARGKGISGLGPIVSSSTKGKGGKGEPDPEEVSLLVGRSQGVLSWLLKNWSEISERVLDEDDLVGSPGVPVAVPTQEEKDGSGGGGGGGKGKKGVTTIDPRLLSPIDLRGSGNERRARRPDKGVPASTTNVNTDSISNPTSIVHAGGGGGGGFGDDNGIAALTHPPTTLVNIGPTPISTRTSSSSTAASPISPIISTPQPRPQILRTSVSHSALKTSPSSGGGLFARAFSSMSIASQASGAGTGEDKSSKSSGNGGGGGGMKMPKRSASFNSLSSLVKKVGSVSSSAKMPSMRSMSDDHEMARPSVNPQITTVLGSLHDLLVSKDKQIERDARELALLRHTLLEMDEKLQRVTLNSPLPGPVGLNGCTCPSHPNAALTRSTNSVGAGVAPEITITSTPSTTTIHSSTSAQHVHVHAQTHAHEHEINDLQSQLSTALAALETSRLTTRRQAERVLLLEAKLARSDGEKRLEVGRLEVVLALEQARAVGLVEERDLARDRLEKVKTTLFSVA